MKSLLDLLYDEFSLVNAYNRHTKNADYWASEKSRCNPNSDLGFERSDYQRYANLEKESHDKASEYELEIAKVRQQILGYLCDMLEEDTPKKKKFKFAHFFKK